MLVVPLEGSWEVFKCLDYVLYAFEAPRSICHFAVDMCWYLSTFFLQEG